METLVAILVASLAIVGLTTSLVAAAGINARAQRESERLQAEVESAAAHDHAVSSSTVSLDYEGTALDPEAYNVTYYGMSEGSIVSFGLVD